VSAAWRSSTNLGGNDIWWRKVGAVFEAFVFEPEDVEVKFVALEQVSFQKRKTREAVGIK
jgi:hypothetical protein